MGRVDVRKSADLRPVFLAEGKVPVAGPGNRPLSSDRPKNPDNRRSARNRQSVEEA
jgi:hypothetical protein